MLLQGTFQGNSLEKSIFRLPNSISTSNKYIALVGLGTKSNNTSIWNNKLGYQLGNLISSISKETKSDHIHIYMNKDMSVQDLINNENHNSFNNKNIISNMIYGIYDNIYNDIRYKGVNYHKSVTDSTISQNEMNYLKSVTIITENSIDNNTIDIVNKHINDAIAISKGVHIAKDLVGTTYTYIHLCIYMMHG
jgi:hypothetical protein